MATNFNKSEASTHAISLVKAALESGAIKLNGALGRAELNAKSDAEYLVTLVNDLAARIASPDYK